MTITDHGLALDVTVEAYGDLHLVSAVSVGAAQWLTENVYEDAVWWNQSLVVEGRYLPALLDGLWDNGYTVRAAA